MRSTRSRTLWSAVLAAALGLSFAAAPAEAQKGPKAGKKAPKGKGKKPPKPSLDVQQKRAALEGSDREAAVAAAEALGESDEPAAHEALLDVLAMGLAPDVAIAALAALGTHPAAGDAAVLGFYTRYRDTEVRAAAAAALGDDTAKILVATLGDGDAKVRAAAAGAAAASRVKAAAKPLLALLAKGDTSAGKALGTIADVELAKVIAEQLGQIDDDLLAECLGTILLRADFSPDAARLEVVRAIGKIAGSEATRQLSEYLSATPESPPRQSRREAEALVDARTGGE